MTNNMPERVIDLFHQITDPDELHVIHFFNACAHWKTMQALNNAKIVAKQIPQSFYSCPQVASSLLDVFTKCGDITNAEILFSEMEKSSGDYGILMNAFNRENKFDSTLKLFQQMKHDGFEPDSLNYLHLIKALSRIGVHSLSQSMLKEIPHSVLADKKIQTGLVDMWVRSIFISLLLFSLIIYKKLI